MKATVKSINKDVTKVTGSGKTLKGVEVVFQGERGSKTEFITSFSPAFEASKSLNVGDSVDIKYVKNGNFFNIVGLEVVSRKQTPASQPVSAGNTKPAYVPREESPERQRSIIRQSSLKTATDIVVAALNKELYKKTSTVDFLTNEVLRIARMYEKWCNGELDIEQLLAPEPVKNQKGKKTISPDDVPFTDEESESEA